MPIPALLRNHGLADEDRGRVDGKKVNVGTGLPNFSEDGRINHEEHEKLAQEDWEIDNGGMGFLDYERFASCWCGGVFPPSATRRLGAGRGVVEAVNAGSRSPTVADKMRNTRSFWGGSWNRSCPRSQRRNRSRRSSIDSLISHLRSEEVEDRDRRV